MAVPLAGVKILGEYAASEALDKACDKLMKMGIERFDRGTKAFDDIKDKLNKLEDAITGAGFELKARLKMIQSNPTGEIDKSSWTFRKMDVFDQIPKKNKKGLAKAATRFAAVRDRILKGVEAEVKGLEKQLKQKKKVADASKRASGRKSQFFEAAQREVDVIQERIISTEVRIKMVKGELDAIEKKIKALNTKITKLVSDIEKAQAVLKTLGSKYEKTSVVQPDGSVMLDGSI